ncbi:hypothetical protein Poli38472_009785 [Pythium oligandrum]|uniref:Uncharacterized protein n=1 Tax=Pythium oligandrum TaxID=41045 RepID=A0A8K1CHM1_PYTOL|nr:hypothetical protein Poli38472_009785 [Pythium oligandrum]|eukprot:TMW62292.1 hypothetical protein Poli38472_009785 [Pythium oligandrum]
MSLLADAIGHNGCLKELNLSYNAIGVLGSTLLATAVTDHRHLRLLDLMHNRIGRDGVSPWLGRTLRSNRVLQELRLTHNDIGDRKGTELVSALAPAPTSEEEQIKRLIARRRTEATAVYPMSKPLKPLAGIIPQNEVGDVQPLNTTLKTLLLGNTGISDEAAVQIGRALAENRTLTHLDISSNAFTSEGHASIARGLERNVSLRYLNYTDNRMSELSGVTLVRALTGHPVLETMLFQDCVGGSAVAVAIADMLQATTTLCTLDLSHCALEPPGVLEFYKSLALNTSMRHLDMTCMGIKSDQVVNLLAKSLEQQPTLRVVNLSYNDITLRGCKSLKDAVTRVNARQERLILALEGNSGEKRQVGVQVTGGLRLPKPISYQPDL